MSGTSDDTRVEILVEKSSTFWKEKLQKFCLKITKLN